MSRQLSGTMLDTEGMTWKPGEKRTWHPCHSRQPFLSLGCQQPPSARCAFGTLRKDHLAAKALDWDSGSWGPSPALLLSLWANLPKPSLGLSFPLL